MLRPVLDRALARHDRLHTKLLQSVHNAAAFYLQPCWCTSGIGGIGGTPLPRHSDLTDNKVAQCSPHCGMQHGQQNDDLDMTLSAVCLFSNCCK